MKSKFLFIYIINILIIFQCKSQIKQQTIDTKNQKILTYLFSSKNGFKEYCDQLDSIFYGLFFQVPCDFIESLDKTRYNEIKKQADSFDLAVPNVSDGGFYFKCDPRLFEFLKSSCEYLSQTPELRMRTILDSMMEYKNSNDIIKIKFLNTLLRVNMKLISEDSIINIYEEIKNNFYLQNNYLHELKFSKNFKAKYLFYLQYLFTTNRNNYENYSIILHYFTNLHIKNEFKNEIYKILLEEKKIILNNSNNLDSIQIKIINYIDSYVSDTNTK